MGAIGLRALLLSLAVLMVAPAAAQQPAADQPIEAFYGVYIGRTLFPMGEQGNRELQVTIAPFDGEGFTVLWETQIPKGSRRSVRKETLVNFVPSPRAGIYQAVYPPGGAPDLIDGDSFTWARLAGVTLTVHVITIVDGGDYVMQTYDRSLNQGGLRLDFLRLRSGVVERQLRGNLRRLAEPLEGAEDQ